ARPAKNGTPSLLFRPGRVDSAGLRDYQAGWRRSPAGHPFLPKRPLSPPAMTDALILAVAAFCAGVLNTVAGGGTFLTFPALVYTGVPVVVANATSAVAVFPGYLGGAVGFRRELAAYDRGRLLRILAATAA